GRSRHRARARLSHQAARHHQAATGGRGPPGVLGRGRGAHRGARASDDDPGGEPAGEGRRRDERDRRAGRCGRAHALLRRRCGRAADGERRGGRSDRAGARGAARQRRPRGAALVPSRVSGAEADRVARRARRTLLPALHRGGPPRRSLARHRDPRRAPDLDRVGDPARARSHRGGLLRIRPDRRAAAAGARGRRAPRPRVRRRPPRGDAADAPRAHRGGPLMARSVAGSAGKPHYRAWFESLHDPSERYALDEVVYTARDGGLLQVVHDLDELHKTPAQGWKRLFGERAHKNEWPYGSGVWGKKEWVCPEVDNENVVSMYEGHSNLFWAERYGRELGVEDLWIKQCGNSHTGSFKDLGMTVLVSMVKEMIARGKSIPAVACASTGDTSAALAAYPAAAGIPAGGLPPAGRRSVA